MTRSRRYRVAPRIVLIVLRAERAGVHALAARADRSLRTLAARHCAAAAYHFARVANMSDTERALRDFLASRPAWTRLSSEQFACSFGARRCVLTVPRGTPAEQLAALFARTEVRVLLGDAAPDFVAHLQTFAARELDRLLSAR